MILPVRGTFKWPYKALCSFKINKFGTIENNVILFQMDFSFLGIQV